MNVVVRIDSADGTSSAANAPWQARAVISMAKLTDAPPMADTTANPASPVRNVTFRPSRSASLPPSNSRLPNASVYAVTTHCRSTVEKCSARCADSSAMFITVRLMITMTCPRPITPRISQRRSGALLIGVTSDMRFTTLSFLLLTLRVAAATVRYCSFSRRSVRTISLIAVAVSSRAQSRCSSPASDTQPIGCPPAWITRSRPARWASGEVPPITSTTG